MKYVATFNILLIDSEGAPKGEELDEAVESEVVEALSGVHIDGYDVNPDKIIVRRKDALGNEQSLKEWAELKFIGLIRLAEGIDSRGDMTMEQAVKMYCESYIEQLKKQ